MDLWLNSFWRLLRCAIKGVPLTGGICLGTDDWEKIYSTACRQSVQGVMFSCIESLPPGSGLPQDLAAKWYADVRRIEDEYARQSAVASKQMSTWKKHGVDAVLLKGLSVAPFYPVPQRRVSGDIDWWMRTSSDWDKALEVLQANGLEWEMDSDGDIHYNLAGVVIEHHREGLVEDGPAGVLYLLNEHIMHHAMVFGVGLRQICDYALALQRYVGTEWEARYRRIVSERGMEKWTGVLDAAVDALLGESVVAENPLIDLVMLDGNMGLDKANRFSGFWKRASLFAKVAPGAFASRWFGLVVGRIKKK